jgi:ornithine cyclodeaminase
MSLLLLNEDELRQIITITEAITALEQAFAASAREQLNVPGSFKLNLPEVNGEVEVEGSYIQEAPYYVIKISSTFQNNPSIHLPAESGILALFDAATGLPAGLMVDNGYLASIRTGAVGALAAKYLANEAAELAVVIGSGSQAYIQLKSLLAVRDIKRVLIWDQSPLDADNYVRHLVEDHQLDIEIAASVEEAVSQADILIIATSGQQLFVKASWLKPGVHITAAGDSNAAKQALYPEIFQRADMIIVDDLEQSLTQGEIGRALAQNLINRADIAGELSSLIVGTISGRTRPDQVTVADLNGLNSQDTVLATLAMEKALFFGLGQRIEMGLGHKGLSARVESLL